MTTIVSVGSGKGGVGKSMLVANLGSALAAAGRRVVLADLDVGGANLAALFGIFDPQATLGDFMGRRIERLDQAVHPISARLGLLAGAGDTLATANPSYGAKQRLLKALSRLDADVVFVDVGAGTGFHALDFFLAGEFQVLVAVPEPPAVLDAYRFVKLAGIRAVSRALPGRDRKRREIQAGCFEEAQDLIEGLDRVDPARVHNALSALGQLRPQLIANRIDRGDLAIRRLCQTVKSFLGRDLPLLARIPEDPAVVRSVAEFLPVVESAPGAPAAVALERAASALLQRLPRPLPKPTRTTPPATAVPHPPT